MKCIMCENQAQEQSIYCKECLHIIEEMDKEIAYDQPVPENLPKIKITFEDGNKKVV